MEICKKCGLEDEGFNFTFHECGDQKAKKGKGPITLDDALDMARDKKVLMIDPEFADEAERLRVVALLASQSAIIRTALAHLVNVSMMRPQFIERFYNQMPETSNLSEWINFANQADDNLVKREVLFYK